MRTQVVEIGMLSPPPTPTPTQFLLSTASAHHQQSCSVCYMYAITVVEGVLRTITSSPTLWLGMNT